MIDRRLWSDFLEWLYATRLPKDSVEHNLNNTAYGWDSDLWSIEVVRCLLLGEEAYLKSPAPEYFHADEAQGLKSQIAQYAQFKIATCQRVMEVANVSNNVIVAEMGRGIDLLLLTFIKNWQRIIIYDTNPYYGDYIVGRWKNVYKKDVTFVLANTGNTNWNDNGDIVFYQSEDHVKTKREDYRMQENCILVLENTRIGRVGLDVLYTNPNIVRVIKNGDMPKTTDEFLKSGWSK